MVIATHTSPIDQAGTTNSPPCHAHAGFYRLNQILDLIPIGKSTWWLWVSNGRAPKAIKLSHSVTAWRKDEIHALIEKLADEHATKGEGALNV